MITEQGPKLEEAVARVVRGTDAAVPRAIVNDATGEVVNVFMVEPGEAVDVAEGFSLVDPAVYGVSRGDILDGDAKRPPEPAPVAPKQPLAVLIEMLGEKGVIDPAEFRERLKG